MKTMKRFLALLLFFVAAMNVQNLSAQTNGDVNNDGNVNEADISAIIEIMKEANGVGPKKYYWYVGQENPASMTSISPIVTDNTSPGWRLIGTTIPTYTFENPLYNADINPIVSNPSKNDYWYVGLPSNSSLSIYNSLKGDEILSGNWTKESTDLNLGNVKYNVYKIVAPQRKFTGLWVH